MRKTFTKPAENDDLGKGRRGRWERSKVEICQIWKRRESL